MKVRDKIIGAALSGALMAAALAGCANTAAEPTPTPVPLPSGVPADVVLEAAGIPSGEVVMKVDGQEVTAEEYLLWVPQSLDQLNQYGLLDWAQEVEGVSLKDYVKGNIAETVKLYRVVERHAAELGYTFTEEDQKDYDEQMAGFKEQLAAQASDGDGEAEFLRGLASMGMTEASFKRVNFVVPALFGRLTDGLFGAEGAEAPTAEAMAAWLEESGTMRAKHILIKAQPSEDGSDDGMAAALESANSVRQELRDAGDTEAAFDELMAKYTGDTDANGAPNSPDGYLFNPETQFVQEFKDGVAALEVGQISEPVQSTFGYHILMRLDAATDEAKTQYADAKMQERIDQWVAEAAVETTEAYDDLDVQAYYEGLSKIRDQIVAAGQPAEPAPTGTTAPAPSATPAG